MNSVDEFIREFETRMLQSGNFDDDKVCEATSILSELSLGYKFEKVGTDIIAYNGVPKEVNRVPGDS